MADQMVDDCDCTIDEGRFLNHRHQIVSNWPGLEIAHNYSRCTWDYHPLASRVQAGQMFPVEKEIY